MFSSIMKLCVWPSDFALPSIDAHCLQFMACAKFCAAPVVFVPSTTPWKSKSGNYPEIIFDDDNHFTDHGSYDFEGFCDLLRKSAQDVVLDSDLTFAERCEFDAFASLMLHSFYPAMLHTLWLDQFNYPTITYHWYFINLRFPYSLYYLESCRRRAQAYVESRGRTEKQLICDAVEAINLIAVKLGENKYFYGDKPTSLDALIFGYLAPILKLPLPSDRLQQHILGCPNLVRFIESIISIYLPLNESQVLLQSSFKDKWHNRRVKAVIEAEKLKLRCENNSSKTVNRLNETLLFCIGAVSLSVFFAIHLGLITIQDKVASVEINDDL